MPNSLAQLAQEGNEGDINLLSAGLGALSGAMTTPGAADTFQGMKIIENLEQFKTTSDVIVANRMNKSLEDVKNKCFSRDLFNNN